MSSCSIRIHEHERQAGEPWHLRWLRLTGKEPASVLVKAKKFTNNDRPKGLLKTIRRLRAVSTQPSIDLSPFELVRRGLKA